MKIVKDKIKVITKVEDEYCWWLRSPDSSTSNFFCHVTTDGTVSSRHAYYSLGVAPAFCI